MNSEYITAVAESDVSQRADGSRDRDGHNWCWSHHGTIQLQGTVPATPFHMLLLPRKTFPSI